MDASGLTVDVKVGTGAMAILHLRKLVDSGWECEKGALQDKECFHCGGEFYHSGPGSGHTDGCVYLAAKAFLAGLGDLEA